MDTNAKYQGKYFSILGDSISTLDGYNPPECGVFYQWENKRLSGIYGPEDTWWGQVIDALGGRLLVNNAWSGTLVSKLPQCEIESYGSGDSRTGSLGYGTIVPNVILVFMGLNDFGWGIPPVALEKMPEGPVFLDAYITMLEKLKSFYPRSEIWCLTLPQSCRRSDPDFVPATCRAGWHITEYCRAIRAAAEKNGCRVLDIRNPEKPYDTIDGYHPNADGMRTIADAVLAEVRTWK